MNKEFTAAMLRELADKLDLLNGFYAASEKGSCFSTGLAIQPTAIEMDRSNQLGRAKIPLKKVAINGGWCVVAVLGASDPDK